MPTQVMGSRDAAGRGGGILLTALTGSARIMRLRATARTHRRATTGL
ncbi:hypothetical protein [Streptomyces diacarni]|nr:hypothetical protein [Streptomyces diacarni]